MQSLNRLKSDRPRRKNDFYETPYELCVAALTRLRRDETKEGEVGGLNAMFGTHSWAVMGVDAGCGKGVWGKAFSKVFWENNFSIGVDPFVKPEENIYAGYLEDDFLTSTRIGGGQQLVYGNPPYSLAEEFVRRGLELASGGYVFFLLRLAFLESKKRFVGLFAEYPPKRVYVLSRRPSFFSSDPEGNKKTTDAVSYAMFLFQNGWHGKTELSWLYWNYDKD
jgi:hypothetical protein